MTTETRSVEDYPKAFIGFGSEPGQRIVRCPKCDEWDPSLAQAEGVFTCAKCGERFYVPEH